jgi:hypothetical protein
VFSVLGRMAATIAVAEGHSPSPPKAPFSCNTIGAVYCTSCSCCVESIFRVEQIAGPEFQHQKRSMLRVYFSSSTDGPRTTARKLVSFTQCSL